MSRKNTSMRNKILAPTKYPIPCICQQNEDQSVHPRRRGLRLCGLNVYCRLNVTCIVQFTCYF